MSPNSNLVVLAITAMSITGMAMLYRLVHAWIQRRGIVAPPELGEIEGRLGRIEQAIDAMAIEVERISEGQRFTTKLLAERAADPNADRVAR